MSEYCSYCGTPLSVENPEIECECGALNCESCVEGDLCPGCQDAKDKEDV